jgi:predicted GTPase
VSDHEPTCGQGLAAGAELPEQIGTLIQAMADVLQDHTRSLAVANTMRSYRDLPMAAHDENTLADQQSLRVFESLVREEEALLGSLQAIASEHREMLGHSAE